MSEYNVSETILIARATKLIVTLALVTAVVLLSAATPAHPKRIIAPNAAFFLATNDDVYEAIAAYAETICVQDKRVDDTPEGWLAAASKCADTYRDDQANVASRDGGWRAYSEAAYQGVRRMCAERGGVDELCTWFK